MEVQVHGRDARGRLGDAERFGFVAQRLLEVLAVCDVGDGADDARGQPLRVPRHLAAGGEPAHRAVRHQRPIFRLEIAVALDCIVQGADHRLEVSGMDGREPIVTGKGHAVGFETDDLEEERRARDLRGHEIEFEDAEAAGALGESQEVGGAVQLGLLLLATHDGAAQGVGQPVEFIAGFLRLRIGIDQWRQRFAQLDDPSDEIIADGPGGHRQNHEHTECGQGNRNPVAGKCDHEPGHEADDGRRGDRRCK